MSTPAPYALLLLSPRPSALLGELAARVRVCLAELGLADGLLDVCTADDFVLADEFKLRRPVAAVYFGAEARAERCTALAADVVRAGWPLLPIVSSLDRFTAEIPDVLHPINGMAFDPDRAANVLLAELGLIRRRRRLFISYLRRESTGVARQLAADLLERGYEVFLDTISVDKGVLFQPALWEAMVDTDIVLFLDTPNALTSRWVSQEFTRATELGVTLLHLLWPGRTRAREAGFAEPITLDPVDFPAEQPSTDPAATLTPAAVDRIAATVERLRAAAWRHRRARITESLLRQLSRPDPSSPEDSVSIHKIDPPTGAIHLTRADPSGPRSIVVTPIHGLPRSQDWHEASRLHEGAQERRLLFQRSGIGEEPQKHIEWLDRHLPAQSLAVEEVEAWLKRP